jgi:hypothetical protein
MKKFFTTVFLVLTFFNFTYNENPVEVEWVPSPFEIEWIKLDKATVYNPTIGQCDDTPNITASGGRINMTDPLSHRWIAISRDLQEDFKFGDTVVIVGATKYSGEWVVMDLMNRRFEKRIDFLTNEKWGRWNNNHLAIRHK